MLTNKLKLLLEQCNEVIEAYSNHMNDYAATLSAFEVDEVLQHWDNFVDLVDELDKP